MFNRKCAVIGMIHALPLPGSAGYSGDMDSILRQAISDAGVYKENGVDALLVENMHDTPYLNGSVEPETTAAMTFLAQTVKRETELPLGVQILAGANLDALGVAVAASLDFIRVEGFVFAHVGDEGIHEACAGKLVRRRAALKANYIKIFADVKKKHSAHAITADVSLSETVHAAEFFQADGVIVTGGATGIAPVAQDVMDARASASISVLVGSGVSTENALKFAPHCDALIVGSSLKFEGKWANPVDPARVKAFMSVLKSAV